MLSASHRFRVECAGQYLSAELPGQGWPPGTVTELEERVRACPSQGYGSSEGAFERGISVVTVPVRERSGAIIAAVTVTVPRSEFGMAREKDDLVTAVCSAAIELSMRMGYQPYDGDPIAKLVARRTEKMD